jgi:sensor histidine kinase YesM
MISMIQKYKRGLTAIGISLFLWIFGAISMIRGIEFTGFLLIVSALLIVLYLIVSWFLNRKQELKKLLSRTKKEVWALSICALPLFLIGIIESSSIQSEFTIAYSLFFIYTLIFGTILIRNYYLQKHGAQPVSSSTIKTFVFWLFGIGVGTALILIENYDDKSVLILTGLVYFPLMFVLIARWIFSQIRSVFNLKNEQAKTELLHLKSQVNPHFFFNMLNNLYGLVEKDSKKAQKLILKLSDMMRYSIYEGQKEVVTLEEEIDYLQSFIELHKMRYHKKIDVRFTVDVEEEGITIMPLLFIILLENAFKHGVENLIENAYIHVNMHTKTKQLEFTIDNNFDPNVQQEQSGIGLKNLKRRLELVYPKRHTMTNSVVNDIYKAKLTLKIK